MSKRNKAQSMAPAESTVTPASTGAQAAVADASTASRPAPAQAARQTGTDNEAALREEALGLLAASLDEGPETGAGAATEAPAGDAEGDDIPAADILTDADAADSNDDIGDAAEAAQAAEAAGEPRQEAAATETAPDDEDLGALAKLSDEQLTEHGRSKGWPATYTKRVGKFTKQLRDAQAQAEKLANDLALAQQAQTQETREPETAPAASLPSVAAPPSPNEQQMMNAMAARQRAIARIDQSPDGLELNGQQLSPQDLQGLRAAYQSEVEDIRLDLKLHQRDKQRALAQEAQSLAKSHPWLADKRNEDAQAFQAALAAYPVLGSMLEGRTMLAEALAYRRLKAAGSAATTAGTGTGGKVADVPRRPAPAPAARPPGRPGAAVVPLPRREGNLNAIHKKAMESGNVEDARALLAAII